MPSNEIWKLTTRGADAKTKIKRFTKVFTPRWLKSNSGLHANKEFLHKTHDKESKNKNGKYFHKAHNERNRYFKQEKDKNLKNKKIKKL